MNKFLVAAIAVAIGLSSCASEPQAKTRTEPYDRGVYNPGKVPESELCALRIDMYVQIDQFDGQSVDWTTEGASGWAPQLVTLAAGAHTISVRYLAPGTYTLYQPIVFMLEGGKSYRLKLTLAGNRVALDVIDESTRSSVKLDTKKLAGDDPATLSMFIKYVLNPTMDGIEHSVRMESGDWILVLKPDMAFTLEDKKTGKTVEGRHGFSMDFSMKSGTVYLFVCDLAKVSREEFLEKSDYQTNSQYVMTPVRCSEKEVVFKFVTPAEMGGKEVVFSITEIK